MRKQWIILSGFFFLTVVLPAYYLFNKSATNVEQPRARQGVLDLSGWNFSENGIVRLNGEWEFYPGQLLNPRSWKTDGLEHPLRYASVPEIWNPYMPGQSGTGYGTYRLLIRVPKQDHELFGIRTINIRTASSIYINGRKVGARGNPGENDQSSVPGNRPYNGYFRVNGSTVEVMIQVSNYNYYTGGIVRQIMFGEYASIRNARDISLATDLILGAGFFVPGIFFLLLYRFRRREPALFYMGCFCFATLWYVLSQGEKLIGAISEMQYEWVVSSQWVSSVVAFFFLVRYVNVYSPGIVHPRVLRLSTVATVVWTVMVLLVPTVHMSRAEPLLLIYHVCWVGYVVYVLIKGFSKSKLDTSLMALGILSIMMVVLLCIAYLLGLIDMRGVVSFETLIFIFSQALLLAKRFAVTFEEVELLSQRLLTLDGLKDEFLANTSHELRTPLHGMINIAQGMADRRDGWQNEEQLRNLKLIVSVGKRLSFLINDILDFSNLKNGRLVIHPAPVNLKAAVQSVLEVLEHTVGAKEIRFVTALPDHLPYVMADEDRLMQMLYNLLGNAVKFTERGQIKVSAAVHGEDLEIRVEDTGVGIPPELHEDIFESFHRGEHTENMAVNGTGLGLSVTKRLIELHGGHIWVESQLGAGAVFTFTLPAAAEHASSASEPAVVGQELSPDVRDAGGLTPRFGKKSKYTILAVDDDSVNLHVLASLLESEECKVIAVQDAQAALKHINGSKHIDLVITDWMMPGVSGLDLCREIRRRFSMAELPVLLLTARNLPGDIHAGLQAEANDFLRKPVDAEELRARVRTLLNLRESTQEAIRSEMAFLQAQIKPHFLYNALNVIISECAENPGRAIELLMELSQYLRSSFDFHNRDQTVPLYKELELVRSYLSLERARFEERLQVEFDIAEQAKALIPPLSIQPIVENAIRHGIMQRANGGMIKISIRTREKGILVVVEDNGVGMTPDKVEQILSNAGEAGGVGLRNIHRRLVSLYGSGLQISSEPDDGTIVSFHIPHNPPA
ncbi:hybrid sensor histidine kinase/response regulator [Paenibacillus jiagnxiensis]|uniref:hybrid sensor histidine kinase/response regulator n=1 Tax=Paenibacillus jiagnxiensis TaxID=3228926 RepID=UPI0038D482ED